MSPYLYRLEATCTQMYLFKSSVVRAGFEPTISLVYSFWSIFSLTEKKIFSVEQHFHLHFSVGKTERLEQSFVSFPSSKVRLYFRPEKVCIGDNST